MKFSEFLAESAKQEQLDEAVLSFKDMPDAWKKTAAFRRAGENSKITVIDEIKKLKKIDDLYKLIRKTAKADGAIKIIEVNDEPVVAMIPVEYESGKYNVIGTDGKFSQTTIQKMIKGTGKSYKGTYIPAKYYGIAEKSFNLSDAAVEAYKIIYSMAKSVNDNLETPYAEPWEALTDAALFNFKAISVEVDEVRAATSADRKQTRNDAANLDTVKMAKMNALAKFIEGKLNPELDKARIEAESVFKAAMSGEKYDIRKLDEALKKVNELVKANTKILSAFADGKAYGKSWSDGKVEFSWSIKDILRSAKN